MKIFLICLGVLYLTAIILMIYEFKHAPLIPDNIDLDTWTPTQEELDEVFKGGKSGI